MRITIRPMSAAEKEIDLTRALVAAIAAELDRLGGNAQVNLIEAERHLAEILAAGAGRAERGDDAGGSDERKAAVESGDGFISACPGCPKRAARNRVKRPGLTVLELTASAA